MAQTYFTSADSLVVQDQIFATSLSPETINLTEHPVYITLFFLGAVGNTPLGIPFTRLMAVISFADPALCYVLTAYLKL